jgi:hypothetical protein
MSAGVTPTLLLALALTGCGGELDAGYDVLHGFLPVDERSAVVMINDGARDNWQGEYAALMASTGQIKLVGLIVNSNAEYPSLETNVLNYRQMLRAGSESGLKHLPEATASIAPALVRPASGAIEDTVPNHSEGARIILEAAAAHSTAVHPLAIATGGALTDVADAYLLDPTLADRAVVVASLGQTVGDGEGARILDPNGIRDSWATAIVISRMPYVQVNGYYDQLLDVPETRAAELPNNAFGRWMADKRTDILNVIHACDQISVLAVALPWFAANVARMRQDPDRTTFLVADPDGPIWHVAEIESTRARDEIWARLKAPATFQ